jgi:hypothetical protein
MTQQASKFAELRQQREMAAQEQQNQPS